MVIVESPTKAATIGKYLGDAYIVMSSVGVAFGAEHSGRNLQQRYMTGWGVKTQVGEVEQQVRGKWFQLYAFQNEMQQRDIWNLLFDLCR